MGSESWMILARRHGFRLDDRGEFRVVTKCPQGFENCIWLSLDQPEAQSLLVGETLRVAADAFMDQDDGVSEWVFIAAVGRVVTRLSDGRAVACLSLLDAVGYPASS